MIKILISACLLGEPVRYDGRSKGLAHPILERWQQEGRLVPICPELQGGLAVPRPAAEIIGGSGQEVLEKNAVLQTQTGEDVTQAFLDGAQKTLAFAQEHRVGLAILKERSPSCGTRHIYDGNFSGTLRQGLGVTAALLTKNHIPCFGETQIQEALDFLVRLEQNSL